MRVLTSHWSWILLTRRPTWPVSLSFTLREELRSHLQASSSAHGCLIFLERLSLLLMWTKPSSFLRSPLKGKISQSSFSFQTPTPVLFQSLGFQSTGRNSFLCLQPIFPCLCTTHCQSEAGKVQWRTNIQSPALGLMVSDHLTVLSLPVSSPVFYHWMVHINSMNMVPFHDLSQFSLFDRLIWFRI